MSASDPPRVLVRFLDETTRNALLAGPPESPLADLARRRPRLRVPNVIDPDPNEPRRRRHLWLA